jgi:hypothetical protein
MWMLFTGVQADAEAATQAHEEAVENLTARLAESDTALETLQAQLNEFQVSAVTFLI